MSELCWFERQQKFLQMPGLRGHELQQLEDNRHHCRGSFSPVLARGVTAVSLCRWQGVPEQQTRDIIKVAEKKGVGPHAC